MAAVPKVRPGWSGMRQRLTKTQRLALAVLSEHGPMTARAFARLRWPDSFMRATNGGPHGQGILLGVGVTLHAGGFLRALCRKGLLESAMRFRLEDDPKTTAPLIHYWLTKQGEVELATAEERAAKYGRPGPKPPRRRAS